MELLVHIVPYFPSCWWNSFSIFQFRKSLISWTSKFPALLTGTAFADYNVYDAKIMKMYFPLRVHCFVRNFINNLRLFLQILLQILDFLFSQNRSRKEKMKGDFVSPLVFLHECDLFFYQPSYLPLKNLPPNPQKRLSSGFLLMFVELALTNNCGRVGKRIKGWMKGIDFFLKKFSGKLLKHGFLYKPTHWIRT